MPGDCLNKVLALCAQLPGRTVRTDLWITFILPAAVTVGGAVVQYLVFRADDTIIVTMRKSPALAGLFRQSGESVVITTDSEDIMLDV